MAVKPVKLGHAYLQEPIIYRVSCAIQKCAAPKRVDGTCGLLPEPAFHWRKPPIRSWSQYLEGCLRAVPTRLWESQKSWQLRSLKNTRDAFDSPLGSSGRVGWRSVGGGPGRLIELDFGRGPRSDSTTIQWVTGDVLPRGTPHVALGEVTLKSPRRAGREKRIGDLAEVLARDHLKTSLGLAAATLVYQPFAS